jgi:single-strand DNA-binding protein
MNKVIIAGRLGQAPELKHTPAGAAVCNFTVATSKKWKDKNGQAQEKTEWHRVVAWAKTAELCDQYLNKGSKVLIEGEIATRSWEDKEGNKRYTTEIICSQIEFMEASGASQDQGTAQNSEPAKTPEPKTNINFASDDIPF